MKHNKRYLAAVAFAAIIGASSVQAAPTQVRIEAKVTDTSLGVPNGSYSVRFRLYPDTSTNTLLWEETQSVVFSNGIFNATLGASSGNPLGQSVFSHSNPTLRLLIAGSSEEIPIEITAVPVAVNATWADYVSNINWASANVTNTPNVSAFGGTIASVQVPDALVTSRMIAAGAILDSHITGPISVSKISGSISSGNISASSVGNAALIDGAIDNTKLQTGVFSNIVGIGNQITTVNALAGLRVVGDVTVSGLPTAPLNRSVLTLNNNTMYLTDASTWDTTGADDVTSLRQLLDVKYGGATVTSYNNVAGYFLQVDSSGQNITFLSPSSVVFGNALALDGLASNQFVRSDASTSLGSGTTLTIGSGATLNINGALSIRGDAVGALATLDQVGATQIANLSVSNSHVAADANISWTKINKAGASFSDFSAGTIGNGFFDAYSNLSALGNIATSNTSASGSLVTKLLSDSLYLNRADNLASLTSTASARANLGLGSTDSPTFLALTTSGLLSGGSAVFSGTVTASSFVGDGSGLTGVTAGSISNGAITSDKLADLSVTSIKIADGTIVNDDVSANAGIAFSKLAITKSDIVGLGIPTADTNTTYSAGSGLDLSGTTFGISSSVVTSNYSRDISITGTVAATAFVGDGSGLTGVTAGSISNGAITSDKLADLSVTSIKIQDGTITNNDVSANAGIAFSKLSITKSDIVGLGVPTADTNTTYTAGTGLTLSGTTFGIGASVVTSSYTGSVGITGTLNATNFVGNGSGLTGVAATSIADGAITTAKLLDSAITSVKILDGTIVSSDIAASAVNSQKIEDGAILNSDINASAAIAFSKLAITKSDIVGLGVPTADTNTTYNAGTGLTLTGTTFGIGSSVVTSSYTGSVGITGTLNATTIVGNGSGLTGIIAASISDGAITSAKILDATIVSGDIAASAINSQKIEDGTILNSDVNASAAIAFSKLAITKSDIVGLGVPTADTNTTYNAGTGLTLTGTTFAIGASVVTSSYTGSVGITGTLNATSFVGNGSGLTGVTATSISDGAITTAKLSDGVVTSVKLADSAVTSAKIADGAVVSADIAAGAVLTNAIADSAINSAKIAANAVLTAAISNSAVTTIKIADSAVTSAKIADATIGSADIAASAIVTSLIADSAITSDKIADRTITSADFGDRVIPTVAIINSAITTPKLADDAVTSLKIADGTIESADITPNAIVTALIADSAVTSAKIVDGTITSADIIPNAVVTALIADSAVTSAKILDGTITSADIMDGTITSVDMAAGSVGPTSIINASVITSKIADGAVTSLKIADSAVTSLKIVDGAIMNEDVSANAGIAFSKLTITKSDIVGLGIPSSDTNTTYNAGTGLTLNGTTFGIDSSVVTSSYTGSINVAGTVNAANFVGNGSGLTGVTAVSVSDGAITSAKILDGTITSRDIADGAITSLNIADATITSADMAIGSVGPTSIINASIITSKIADGAVTSAKIADATIVSADIAASAIVTSLIADSAITSDKIANGTITNDDIASGASIAFSKLAITAADLGLGAANSPSFASVSANGTSTFNAIAVGSAQFYTDNGFNFYSEQSAYFGASGKLVIANTEFTYSGGVYIPRYLRVDLDASFKSNVYVTGNVFVTGSITAKGPVQGNAADYAEYLERANPSEKIGAADVVGMTAGKVSRSTEGVHRAMVISTQPLLVGNLKTDVSGYEVVAFMGQVPVRVVGKVVAGDYIIPSGKNDGTGVAIAPEFLEVDQLHLVVGQAWESSDNTGEKLVRVGILPVAQFSGALQSMNTKLQSVQTENESLKSELQSLRQAVEELRLTIKR